MSHSSILMVSLRNLMAERRGDAEKIFVLFLARYQVKYDKDADYLAKDYDVLLACYDFLSSNVVGVTHQAPSSKSEQQHRPDRPLLPGALRVCSDNRLLHF